MQKILLVKSKQLEYGKAYGQDREKYVIQLHNIST